MASWKSCVRSGALGIALMGAATTASANIMWVLDNQNDNVYTIDVTTAMATLVGNAGVNVAFGGLGFAQDGSLYGMNSVQGGLHTVNQGNGAWNLVGNSPVFGMDTFDINPVSNEGIAVSVGGEIHTINLGDGSSVLRANTAANGIASAFGPDGTYYWLNRGADRLATIDIDTGAVADIGALGLNTSATNLAYNPADDMLYFVEILDANFPLYRVDPGTGLAVFVGNVTGLGNNPSQQITMSTFDVAGFARVPEPASLALLGAGVALLGFRRRRT